VLPFRILAAICLLLLAQAGAALAQNTYSWNNTGTAGTWFTTSNWTVAPSGTYAGVGTAPNAGNINDIATFNTNSTIVSIDGSSSTTLSLGTINYTSTSSTGLTVGNSSTTASTPLTITLNGALSGNALGLNAGMLVRNFGSTLLTLGANAGSGNQGTTYALGIGTGTIDTGINGIRIDGIVSGGANGFTKTGFGTLTLNGANTYTGLTTVQFGTLQIGTGGTTGSINGNVAVQGASSLVFNRSDNLTYGGQVTGLGTLRQIGSGTLTLTNNNDYLGATTITGGGTISISSDANLGSAPASMFPAQNIFLNNGTLATTASFTLQDSRWIAVGPASGSGSGTLNVIAGTLTYNGNIENNGSSTSALNKSGAGLLILGGTNSFSGGLNVNQGPLQITSQTALGTGTFTIGTGAATGATTSLTAAPLGVNITSAVALANNVALPAFGAATTISIVKASAGAAQGTELNFTGNITGGNSNLTMNLSSTAANDNTTNFRLSGNNNFSGTINLTSGILSVNSATGLGNAQVRLNSTANTTTGNLSFQVGGTFSNPITVTSLNTSPIGVTGSNTVTLSGALTTEGASVLRKVDTGTLITTASNNLPNGINISAGTFQVGNGGTAGTLGGSGGVAVQSGATLVFNRSDNATFSNAISGAGTVTKAGSGTTVLSGNSTYTGPTNVTAGTLSITGNNSLATGAVNVLTGTTLGGIGTVGGAITVQSGGTLRGDTDTGTGTLTVQSVTISTGGNLLATIGASGTNSSISLGGQTLDFLASSKIQPRTITGFDRAVSGSWIILSNVGTLRIDGVTQGDRVFAEYIHATPSTGPVLVDITELNASLQTGDLFWVTKSGTNITLNYGPVPEPVTVLSVAALGLGAVLGLRRRK
jgi:autotransporter-associated beta strand protein